MCMNKSPTKIPSLKEEMTLIVVGDKIKHSPWRSLDGIKNKKVQLAWKKFLRDNPDADLVAKATIRSFAESVER